MKIARGHKSLSVIIPVFNEKKTLPKIVRRVLKRAEVREVVIVDDGSTDGSLDSVRPLVNSQIKLLRLERNQGKGAAMIKGLKAASSEWIIFQDADLESNPDNYPKLLTPLKAKKAQFVIGNRWKNNNGRFLFKLGNWLLTAVINILFNSHFSDSYCGYKVTSKKIWDSLNLNSKRFEIEAEIVAKIASRKIPFTEVDVDYDPRSYSQGKKIKWIDVAKGMKKILEVWLSS